nr:transglutaminase domain-containing protein [Cohnella mopanensis]
MSIEEKYKAIYDYLNDNTKYDMAALDSAKENNFQVIDSKFNDSFTTYGIMVKKVGVCASYASVYKMLSDLAGLESIVVTGDMGGVPHAWNKVKLNNSWFHVDSTNNDTNSGIPYLLFNSSDKTAESLHFTLSQEYWLDSEIDQFNSSDGSKDYYVVNGLEVSTANDYGTKLEQKIKEGSTHIVIRLAGKIDEDDLFKQTMKALSSLTEDKLENAQMGSLSPYIVVKY